MTINNRCIAAQRLSLDNLRPFVIWPGWPQTTSAAVAHQRKTRRPPQSEWLTLTDLGRIYGISALHCGRLLLQAGLRRSDGEPTQRALQAGCASAAPGRRHGQPPVWHRSNCRAAFEAAGLDTVQRATLVQQWANLLSALTEGSAAISTSADQMAEEMPGELVEPVNRQLRELGCSFQVSAPVGPAPHRRPAAGAQSQRRREERGTARPEGLD